MLTLLSSAVIAVAVEGQPGKFRYYRGGCEVYPIKSTITGQVIDWVKIWSDCAEVAE